MGKRDPVVRHGKVRTEILDMEVKFGQVGRIIAGDEAGKYVKVVDDKENTGGYLILTAAAPDTQVGFDHWVESKEALSSYFVEARWSIEWL